MLFEKIELEPNEKIIRVARKHWFVISVEIIGALIVAVLPLFLGAAFLLIESFHPANFFPGEHTSLILFAGSFWLLITLLTTFMIWTHYFLDLWVVTDRRIIVIDQIHFFNRKVSSFRLEKLQDIKASVDGVIPTLLNFGTIHVHTAGSDDDNFTTHGLPDPRELQATIQKATDERLRSLHGTSLASAME